MPQTKYDVEKIIGSEDAAEKLKAQGSDLSGVKWVNVNQDSGVVVITHDDSYDESALQAIIDSL